MRYSRTDIAKGFVAQADKHGVKRATKETAALLLEQGLHTELDQILTDIAAEYAKQKGIVEAEVKTAYKLTSDTKADVIDRIKKTTGAKKVTINEVVDSTLLGGVIITAPDMELDLSLRTKLAKLKA